MKRLILLTPLLLLAMHSLEIEAPDIEFEPHVLIQQIDVKPKTEWDYLISAIYQLESSSGQQTIGDNGKAVGPFQIHECMVDDVNRIVGYKKFSYQDRYNYNKSLEMFNIYQRFYNPNKNIEAAARMWNGGPTGMKKHTTKKYYKQIKNLMS